MKMPRVDPKAFSIAAFVCVALGALFSWLSGMPAWISTLIVVAALIINALIAVVEDRPAGGSPNPTDKE